MELDIREIAQWFLAAILSVSPSSLPAQTRPCSQEWGKSVDGLQMSLYLDSPQTGKPEIPSLRVSLRNIGTSDKVVEYGAYCGRSNLERNQIAMIFTDDQGKSLRVFNLGPGPPFEGFCAGVLSHLRIPLASGAVYSIPINLDHYGYLSEKTWVFERGWRPGGTYSLQAALVGEKGTDEVLSNVLRVHFPHE